MASGDISHKPFAQIGEICRNYSRIRGKFGRNLREPYNRNLKGNTPISEGVTRVELGNLLENFKTNILGAMGSQLDVLQVKKRQEEECAVMSIFFPTCRTKHPQQECPLNSIFVCHICTEEHPIDDSPLLPGLQSIYKSGDIGEILRRPPWQPRDPPPSHNLSPQPPPYYQPTNYLNIGTLQVGSIGHPSILLLLILLSSNIGHRGGGDNPTTNHHISLHLIIYILNTHPIPNNFY